jgi:hypothetical protein
MSHDRARHPWDRPTPERSRPAAARIRWGVRLVVLGVVAISLYPAIGEDAGAVDVGVQCGPGIVGVATECTATITLEGGIDLPDGTGAFPIRVGTFDNEQGGQPTAAEAVARAREFDVITAGPTQYRGNVAEMHAANPDLVLHAYVNGTHTRNTGLPEAQYCHDASGARITTNGLWSGNILMNPGNLGWRTTLHANVKAALIQSGYDGAFLDVLGRGALQYNVTGRCIDPRTGREYTIADWERDTSELARAIKEQTLRPVIANGASRGVIYFSPPASSVIAQHADGGLAEGFTRNGAFFEGYYTESQVLQDVRMVADGPVMHVLAKDWRSVGSDVKDREMRYAFAAFLLGTNGNDVFGWTASPGAWTRFDPLWDVDLGAPRGPHYAAGPGLFRRDFARGHVLLDTVAHTGSIALAPTGGHTVAWSSTGNGTFEAPRCTFDGGSTTTCQVRYIPGIGSAGPHAITATDVAGDGSAPVAATTSIDVARRGSTTAVSCATPVTLPDRSTCTVTVSDVGAGAAAAPTGDVSVSTGAPGAFDAPTCALTTGSATSSSCTVTYSPAAAGEHLVTAAFGGDGNHKASQSQSSLTVEPEVVVDTTAPVVEISSPVDGTTIKKGRTIKVVATATDDVGVSNLEFAADGVVMCSDVETSAMTCAWAVPKSGSTGFTVTVTASDAAGNVGTQQIAVVVATGRV